MTPNATTKIIHVYHQGLLGRPLHHVKFNLNQFTKKKTSFGIDKAMHFWQQISAQKRLGVTSSLGQCGSPTDGLCLTTYRCQNTMS